MSSEVSILSDLFKSWSGVSPASLVTLAGAGSNRRYFRLSSEEKTAIGVLADDPREARAFLGLARCFLNIGVPVPAIYESAGETAYIQQDLGSVDLLSLIKNGEERDLPEKVLAILPKLQLADPSAWCGHVAFNPFSRRLAMWDLNYFKYEFLRPAAIPFDEELLEDDFERLALTLSSQPKEALGFMWRDCQSRNVMVADGQPYFIDFQGGRLGPAIYDAVSFIWQAKAGFSSERRSALMDLYISEFCSRYSQILDNYATRFSDSALSPRDLKSVMEKSIPPFVVFRLLQVLGAYGFRGLVEHKAHFVESIPAGLANLKEAVDNGWLDSYPELRRVANALCSHPRFQPAPADGLLHVRVFSFSYKKGYPEDLSGNGGGFMFDCRGMHNPGRYPEYRQLTGLDTPVRKFLEDRGEIQKFIENAYELVRPAVATYLRRKFSSLQVGCGCTGGRHRSVYSAQALAERIAQDFPEAVVDLYHREQSIRRRYHKGKSDSPD